MKPLFKFILSVGLFTPLFSTAKDISICNTSQFLTELSLRQACDEYKKSWELEKLAKKFKSTECSAIEVAQKTDDPVGVMYFMMSVQMPGSDIEKMATSKRNPISMSKLMREYFHDIRNINSTRQMLENPKMGKALLQQVEADPEMNKQNREFYDKAMKLKSEIYRKLGAEAPKAPPYSLMGPQIDTYPGETPADKYLRAREKLERARRDGFVPNEMKAEVKASWLELEAHRAQAKTAATAAKNSSGTTTQVRGTFISILPDLIDPGPIKVVDYRRLTCPKGSFAAYDALPKEYKMVMHEPEKCLPRISTQGIQMLMGNENDAMGLVEKNPAFCKSLEAQLEDLRRQQGYYRSQSGVVDQDSSSASGRR